MPVVQESMSVASDRVWRERLRKEKAAAHRAAPARQASLALPGAVMLTRPSSASTLGRSNGEASTAERTKVTSHSSSDLLRFHKHSSERAQVQGQRFSSTPVKPPSPDSIMAPPPLISRVTVVRPKSAHAAPTWRRAPQARDAPASNQQQQAPEQRPMEPVAQPNLLRQPPRPRRQLVEETGGFVSSFIPAATTPDCATSSMSSMSLGSTARDASNCSTMLDRQMAELTLRLELEKLKRLEAQTALELQRRKHIQKETRMFLSRSGASFKGLRADMGTRGPGSQQRSSVDRIVFGRDIE